MGKLSKKHRFSLRIKLTIGSILILCLSCFIAYFTVFMSFSYIYKGNITGTMALFMCLIACIITIILGGIALWHSASYVTNPINDISKGVQKVADGDFTVQLSFTNTHGITKNHILDDEITTMASNFNKMTRELNAMAYMNKDFISNVSHEINTPISVILGYTEMLIDGGLTEEEQKEFLSYIYDELQRLSRMSDNMLRMSRLDNQNIVVLKQKVEVDELIRRCIISLSEKWSQREIQYELELENITVLSDYDLLYQILINLIDNSIKYSEEQCTIWITTKVLKNQLEIVVRDNGIGIAKENIVKLYDKFYQCDESHKRQGNGLGLSIVKRIVELMEGTILCNSQIGEGTVMTILLPYHVE